MLPEIHILGLTLQSFGICFALAFIAAGVLVQRRMVELGWRADHAQEMIFAALVGGLVGSRLYWMAEHWSDASDDLLGSIFSGSGLTWYGGAIGGTIGVVLWAWRRGHLGIDLLDLCAPALALGYAIGRIGCQLSGDGDYGKPWDGPWAMAYPDGKVPTTEHVHPTPVYETMAMAMVAWVLWRWRDRLAPGLLFAWYLVLAGAERFLVEFLRRNDEAFASLTTAQLESLVLIAAGLIWIGVKSRATTT